MLTLMCSILNINILDTSNQHTIHLHVFGVVPMPDNKSGTARFEIIIKSTATPLEITSQHPTKSKWCVQILKCHEDVIKWKHFPRYWPFVREIHWSPDNSPQKANDAELWWFFWSAPEQMLRSWLFETPSRSLWCHCNGTVFDSRFTWQMFRIMSVQLWNKISARN